VLLKFQFVGRKAWVDDAMRVVYNTDRCEEWKKEGFRPFPLFFFTTAMAKQFQTHITSIPIPVFSNK